MARVDYYAVLGLKRTASTDDIKKAFRALALRYHPDRNPDDVDAERQFREATEAYQVLSDPEERVRYDRLGPFYRPDGRPPSTEDLGEMVGETLAGLFRKKRPSGRGEDLNYTLQVSLEDAAAGAERAFDLAREIRCKRCHGDGAEPEVGRKHCETCDGSGRNPARRLLRTDCPRCDGKGFVVIERCKRCSGAGRMTIQETLKVKVPPGVATGQKLKLRGKGNAARAKGQPGDVYILVSVAEHPLFRRRGADLFCEVPVTLTEAALGAELDVPTLDGHTRIKLPPGTPSGKVFRLAGRGLAGRDGRRKGDLHIKTVVEVPSELTRPQRDALHQLADTLGLQAHPRRRAFQASLSERG